MKKHLIFYVQICYNKLFLLFGKKRVFYLKSALHAS